MHNRPSKIIFCRRVLICDSGPESESAKFYRFHLRLRLQPKRSTPTDSNSCLIPATQPCLRVLYLKRVRYLECQCILRWRWKKEIWCWKDRVTQKLELPGDVLTSLLIRALRSAQNQFHQFSSNSVGKARGDFRAIITVNVNIKKWPIAATCYTIPHTWPLLVRCLWAVWFPVSGIVIPRGSFGCIANPTHRLIMNKEGTSSGI